MERHELPGGAARFHPREPARDQEHQLIEQHPPAGGVYAVASGHRKIIGRRHNPRMITRWPFHCRSYVKDHEVTLPY